MNKQLFIVGLLIIVSFILLSMMIPISENQDPWEVPEEYENMINPYFGVKDKENIGRMLFLKHCKTCHGSLGKGDGNKAQLMDYNMVDFTDNNFKEQKDGALYFKMITGRNDMPAFKKKIKSTKEQWFIINYIRKLTE